MFALAFGLIAAPHLAAPPSAVADAKNPEDAGTARLSISAGVHGVVQPEAALTTTVTVDNAGDETIPAGRVVVELNRTALADAEALATWLDSGQVAGAFTTLGTEEFDAVSASESSTTFVSTTANALGDLPAGVYPIRGGFSGDMASGSLTANSVLIVSADSSRQITVLVPITATPVDGGLLAADELRTLTAPDGALTAQLDGVAGTSAVLAVDPLIPAAIRALGSAAPVDAAGWLERLESMPNERFALQAGDADAAVQAGAQLPELLAPLPLASYLDPTNFVETEATASPAPSPSPTPTEPELPDNDELMTISGAESGILWPLGDVRTADLSTFEAYLGADATTILPSTSLAASTSALVEIDGHRVLVADADASVSLSGAAASIDEGTREREIAQALAQLTYTGSQASLLVGLDRDETRTADALRETILSLSAVAQPVDLSGLRAMDPASSTLVGETATERVGTLENLLADEERLESFATILDDPLVLLAPERIALLRLIGVGTADDFTEDAIAHRTATVATLGAVGVQQPSPIQLFTAAAPLPVWVRNDLPWPVHVTLASVPSDARLDVRPSTPVEAQPASNTRVKVPVEARVGSGTLNVHFSLTSPAGVHIGADQTATVTVRAEWEGIGLGILGGIIGLLLVLGIVRTIVRRRREQ